MKLLSAFILLSLAVTGSTISVNDCPSSLDRDASLKVNEDKCYRFVLDQKLDFDSAQKQCQLDGGNLAMVKSKSQNDFLGYELQHTYKMPYTSFWIGVRYSSTYGRYTYVDGSFMNYDNLDTSVRYNPGDKDCVAFNYDHETWYDYACDDNSPNYKLEKLNYICEYQANPQFTVQDCPSGLSGNLHVFEDKCYQFQLNTRRDYDAAQQYCQLYGGNLAMIKSEGANEFLKSAIYSTHSSYTNYIFMIGLKYNYLAKSYQWVDGTKMEYDNIDYPDSYNTRCVSLVGNRDKWYNTQCDIPHRFICEHKLRPKPTLDECPKNLPRTDRLKVYDGKCYSFETDKSYTFDDAEAFCEKNGGTLAIINSHAANEFINSELKQLTRSNAWIGLVYSLAEQKFRWIDKSELGYIDYHKKHYRYFYNANHCGVMQPSDGLWNFQICNFNNIFGFKLNSYLPFICQYNAVQTTAAPVTETTTTITTTSTPTTSSSLITKDDCPVMKDNEKFVQVYNDKCYYFNIDSKLMYKHAQAFCQTNLNGGKLADAASQNVDNFLKNQLQHTYQQYGYFWIGNHFSRQYYYKCLAIHSSNGFVYPMQCNDNILLPEKFICEFEANKNQNTQPPITVPQKPTKNELCPVKVDKEELIQILDETCYLFNFTHKLDYDQAERYCRSIGGGLVMIKSKEINDFLTNHLTFTHEQEGLFWIGLRYNYTDSRWDWFDGTHVLYHNFRSLQVQHSCVVLSTLDGKWETKSCSNKYYSWTHSPKFPYICQFPAAVPTHSTTTKQTTPEPTTKQTTTLPSTTPSTSTQPSTTQTTTLPSTIPSTSTQPPTTKPTTRSTTIETTSQLTTIKQPSTQESKTTRLTTSQPLKTTQPTKIQETTKPMTKPSTAPQSTTGKPQTTQSKSTPPQTTPLTTKSPITTESSTTQPLNTTRKITKETTETPPIATQSTDAPSTTAVVCQPIVCNLDCGLIGYKSDPVTGCPICKCDNN